MVHWFVLIGPHCSYWRRFNFIRVYSKLSVLSWNKGFLKEEMKWKLSLLHLQDLLKVIKNVFYSFSMSHFQCLQFFNELFKFVWNVNETTSDVKLCRSFKVTRKSCTSLRLINNTWSCDVQRVHMHLICKVLSDFIH